MATLAASATIGQRVTGAWRAFLDPTPPPTPRPGELGWANPDRLWPQGESFGRYNPSALVTRRGLRIFDQMRLDDQVKAALSLKKHATIAGDWEVTPPEDAPEDHEPTRFVLANLEGLAGTFEDDLLQILTALDWGFSVTELLWAPLLPTRSREFAGRIGLEALKTRAPHSFQFRADEFGNLDPTTGLQQEQQGRLVPLPAGKFLIFVHQQEFGNWYGVSDLEAAYRAWWLKENAYRWLGIYLERHAAPGLFGVYDPRGLAPEQIRELKTLVRDFQAATSGLIPRVNGKEGFEFWSPPHGGNTKEVFIPALDQLNRDIARALLMPGLLGMTADAEEGSFARAKVHFEVFLLAVESIRRQLAERIQETIVRPLVDLNYVVDEYPLFRFLPLTDDVRLDVLTQWSALIGARVTTPQAEDEIHIRSLLRMPKLSKPAVADLPPPAPMPAEGEGEGETREQAAVVLTRAKTRVERAVDFVALARGLDAVEAAARASLGAVFAAMRDGLLADLDRRGAQGVLAEVRLKRRAEVQTALQALLLDAYSRGAASLKATVGRTMQESGPSFVPTEALKFLREKALHVAGVTNDRLVGEVKVLLLQALKTGEPLGETVEKLKALFAPFVGDPGVLRDGEALSPARLETIIRTNTTEAFNQGRLVAAREPAIAEGLHGLEYSAILDDRTTEVCRLLDGRIFRLGDPDLTRLTPPNHFNCRSVLVPVTLDIAVDEADFVTETEIGKAKDLAGKGFV